MQTTSNRKFGLTVGTAFLVLAGIVWWRDHLWLRNIFGGVGGFLIVAGLIVPAILGPVQRGWMRMALAISKVTTPIFMGIAYYLSVVPIAFAMKLLGKNPIAAVEKDSSFGYDRAADGNLTSDMTRQF